MEFLPTNLTFCIEQYGILPKEISYSILHDVALGLCYLHSQTPPIIHRDLSSNNVLLTPNMTAKISDLGVARILNLTPLQVSRMTQTPGTPAYMPPEVMVANPKYDSSIDIFSYGILMIHTLTGKWPEPQVGPIRARPTRLIPVSEAERRDVFLQAIGSDHPLLNHIRKCIDNHPRLRPRASDIVKHLADALSHFPASSMANRLEMLRRIESHEEERKQFQETLSQEKQKLTRQLAEKTRALEEKDAKISQIGEQLSKARDGLATKSQVHVL
jgi:serine/threonine protein kinase